MCWTPTVKMGYLLSLAFCLLQTIPIQPAYAFCLSMPTQSEAWMLWQQRCHGTLQLLQRNKHAVFFEITSMSVLKSIFRKFYPLNSLLNTYQEKTRIMNSKNSRWECCEQWEKAFSTFIYSYSTWRQMYDRIITHCHKNPCSPQVRRSNGNNLSNYGTLRAIPKNLKHHNEPS